MQALIELMSIGILRIRNLGFSGDPRGCAIEADHLHNIPNVMKNLDVSHLEYYLTVDRESYIRGVSAEEARKFERPWTQLEKLLSELKDAGESGESTAG